ncbi:MULTISPECIES: hypothetical protein [Providencia]|nr:MULTISPECIES: hypothetical protein [Providencia]WOB88600.1 hypothetical protein P3L40_23590 [Providencia sp. PROV040]
MTTSVIGGIAKVQIPGRYGSGTLFDSFRHSSSLYTGPDDEQDGY